MGLTTALAGRWRGGVCQAITVGVEREERRARGSESAIILRSLNGGEDNKLTRVVGF